MNAEARRQEIARLLREAEEPQSAKLLAERFSVSRQVIVGDVAILRAGGLDVNATPRGYVLPRERSGIVRAVACSHSAGDMETELTAIVDNGGAVLDVAVEHSVYGEISARLDLRSRYDVAEFVKKVENAGARALSTLTDGVHLHNIRCPDEAAFSRVEKALEQLGFLYRSEE